MPRFTPTEIRSLSLALALLALGTAARLLLAPGPSDFAWRPSAAPRPAETVDGVRKAVEDTLRREAEASRPLGPGETIDVNHADAVQLQRLPGVGPSRAAAILAERLDGGAFRSLEDLDRVRGIGRATARRWAGMISFGAVRGSAAAPARPEGPVDLNRAHPKDLEQITGIGPALARRIVEARTRRGRFRTVDDLLEVPGIGPRTLEILREQAVVR